MGRQQSRMWAVLASVVVVLGINTLVQAAGSKVYAVGGNVDGQLGDGTWGTPAPVLTGDVRKIAAGAAHALALKTDGTVWAWGFNQYGELGDGTTTSRTVPTQVPGLMGVVDVAGGLEYSLALKADGTIWGWGSNDYGELGDGTRIRRLSPVPQLGLTGAVAIAAGGLHALALKADGTVWTWGWYFIDEHGYDLLTPAQIPNLTEVVAITNTLALKSDGTVWSLKGGVQTPIQIRGLTGITAITTGGTFCLALKSDGTVWAWGSNESGQLGDGTYEDRTSPVQVCDLADVTVLAAGMSHALAVRSDGTVWGWGRNWYGELGDGTSIVQSRPVRVHGLTTPIALAAGDFLSLALNRDGTVLAWGLSDYVSGQLASGPYGYRSKPVHVLGLPDTTAIAAGGDWIDGNSLALQSDGTVWAWGQAWQGQRFALPTPVPGLSGVIAVAAAEGDSLALATDGTVWAWMFDSYTPPGGTDNTPFAATRVAGLTGVTSISQGSTFGLAARSDGTIWAWGWNDYGQLGNGTTSYYSSTPVQVLGLAGVTAMSAGGSHSLILKSDGTVWGWGNDWCGQVGDGASGQDEIRTTPVQVCGLTEVTAISAGGGHSLAVKSDGAVWAWGYGYGPSPVQISELSGMTTVVASKSGDDCLAIKSDGTAWKWRYDSTPIQVAGLSGVTAAAVGSNHTLFLAKESTIAPSITGTWPVAGTTELPTQAIVVGFDRPVLGVSTGNLLLSAGTVTGVEGSGQGPYTFAVASLPPGTITAFIAGAITSTDGLTLPPYQWTFQITQTPINPSPADGTVSVAANAPLAWGGAPSYTFDVYLDTVSPPTTRVATGLSSAVYTPASSLQPGATYYWQVVGNGSSAPIPGPIWSFTVSSSPACPGNPNPTDGSVGTPNTAAITWSGAAPGVTFDVYLDTANPPVAKVATGLCYASYMPAVILAPETTYYWQVIASNGSGTTAGPVWSFTVGAGVVPYDPSPSDNGIAEIDVTLSWGGEADGVTFDLYLDTINPPVSRATRDPLQKGIFKPWYLSTNTRYYWQVVATYNGVQMKGPVWSFVVRPAAVPTDPTPTDGQTSVSAYASLSWIEVDPVTSYDVYLDTVNPPIAKVASGLTGIPYTPDSRLQPGTTYYWKVVACGNACATHGPVWSFTTNQLPSMPDGPAPSDGAVVTAGNPTLSWNGGAAGVTFDVYVDTVNPPAIKVAADLAVATFTTDLPVSTAQYYWQVVAKNNVGQTPGPIWSFTMQALPDAPGSPAPSDSLFDVPTNAVLSWSRAAPGVTFDIYLDTVTPPVAKIASDLSAPTFTRTGLAEATHYYWQIIAKDSLGQTPGPVWTFTTRLTGDISGDGYVNVRDLQILIMRWGSTPSFDDLGIRCDLNRDGYIGVIDLQILVANWGRSSH